MSFSSIAIQREKEIKALKTFLVYSTFGSLVLHIAVLASGIGNLLTRVPELDEKPIELTFVEPEVKETPIKEEKKPSPEDNKLGKREILTSSRGNGGEGSIAGTSAQSSPQLQSQQNLTLQALPQTPLRVSKPIEKPIVPQAFTPVQKQVETKQRDVTRPQPQKEDPVVSKEPQKPVNNTPKETTEAKKPVVEKTQPQESEPTTKVATNIGSVQSSTSSQESSENLTNTLGKIRDSRATQTGSGNSSSDSSKPGSAGNSTIVSGSGTGNGTGNGNGNGSGTLNGTGNANGTGNGTGSGRREIAVAPTQTKIPTQVEKPEGNGGSGGSGDGRAACKDCKVKYSEGARRRKAEGRVEVAVDTDKDGNVTNARLSRSSGDRELDEEHLRQARQWKLKPAEQGRQGVNIATEYSISGSSRNRKVRERQQQREERERQRQVAAASSDNNNSGDETSRRRRRNLEASSGNNTDVSVSNGRRRRNLESSGESASSNESSRSSRLSQRLRRRAEVSASRNEDETPRQRVRNSEQSSIRSQLRRPVENNSGEAAPRQRRRREVTADVRTSGEQQAPTRRRRRELNQSNQYKDSGNRLRSVLRRSRESAPPAPSSGGEGE
jgi:TonB family protein